MAFKSASQTSSPVEKSPSTTVKEGEQPSKSSYRHYRQAYGTVDKQRAPPQIERSKKPLAFDRLGPKYLRDDLLAPLPTTTQPLLSRDRSAREAAFKKSSPTLPSSSRTALSPHSAGATAAAAVAASGAAAESSGDETAVIHFSATEQEAALFFRHERALNSLAVYTEDPQNRLQLIEEYVDIIDRVIEFCMTRPSRALQDRAAYILRLLSSDYSLRMFLMEHQILPALKAAIQNGVREVRQHLYMTLEYLVARPLVRSAAQSESENGHKTVESVNVAQKIIDLALVPLLLERLKKEKGTTERITLANVLSSVAVYNCEPLLLEPQAGKPQAALNCLDICMDLLSKFRDLSTDLTTAACRLLQTLCISQRGKNLAANRNLVGKLTKIAREAALHTNLHQLRDDVLQILGLITAITINKHLKGTIQETMDTLEGVIATTTPPPVPPEATETGGEPLTLEEQEELAAEAKAESMRAKTRLHALTVLCNISENPNVRERLRPYITRRDVWLNIYDDPNELVRCAAARLRKIVMWNP